MNKKQPKKQSEEILKDQFYNFQQIQMMQNKLKRLKIKFILATK